MSVFAWVVSALGMLVLVYNHASAWAGPLARRVSGGSRPRPFSGIPFLGSIAVVAGTALGGPLHAWIAAALVATDPSGPVALLWVACRGGLRRN